MVGQLYKVKTKGRLQDTGFIETCSYILSSESREDVDIKTRYFIDISLYSEFSIISVTRLKPNFHLIHRNLKESECFADTEMQDQVGKECTDHMTLQRANINMFAFGLIGNIMAGNEKSALLKLSTFLAKKAMGANISLPFSNSGHFVLDKIGETDNTKVSNMTKNEVFTEQMSLVSGGGCSPK